MITVRVVTDSTADIPPQLASALDITVIPDQVIFGQQPYRDGVDITLGRFLELLAMNPHLPKTAQPSLGVFLDTYRRLGQDEAGIVSIHVGYHLSGMVRTAQAAAAELSSEVRVAVVDSQQLSMAQGWQVIAAARAAQQGASFDQVVALAQQLPPLSHAAAMLDSLDHARRGGRIGRLAALMGAALRVKPLINVVDGHPALLGNVRTRRKALDRLAEHVATKAPFLALAVLHVNAPEAAASLADRLSTFYPRDNIPVGETGAAVATHLGPGAVGICLVSEPEGGIDPGLFYWPK
jgi:DegV family protein with EDD domain